MDTTYVTFCVLAFISVVLLLEASYYWYQNHYGSQARRIKSRLLKIKTGQAYDRNSYQTIIKQRYVDQPQWLNALLDKYSLVQRLDELTYQSGMRWSLMTFCQYSAGAAFFMLLLAQLAGSDVWPTGILMLLGLVAPFGLAMHKRALRLQRIEVLLPEAIDAMTRSLKAGHTVQSAIQLVADELPDPIASEFRIFIEEINLGASFNDALQNLAKRIPLTDLKYLVIAMLVQRDTGGNLFEILTSISKIIRERFKFQGQIRVLSSEGRMSAWVLCCLPVVMFFVGKFMNPKQMNAFIESDFGQHGLMYGLVLMLIGIVSMANIIKIKL